MRRAAPTTILFVTPLHFAELVYMVHVILDSGVLVSCTVVEKVTTGHKSSQVRIGIHTPVSLSGPLHGPEPHHTIQQAVDVCVPPNPLADMYTTFRCRRRQHSQTPTHYSASYRGITCKHTKGSQSA